nr:13940_t:CDS:2 [Entrophospora candida]
MHMDYRLDLEQKYLLYQKKAYTFDMRTFSQLDCEKSHCNSHNQESVGDDNEDELLDANEVTNDMTLRDDNIENND